MCAHARKQDVFESRSVILDCYVRYYRICETRRSDKVVNIYIDKLYTHRHLIYDYEAAKPA